MTAARPGDPFHLDIDGTVIAGHYIEVVPPHRIVIGLDHHGTDPKEPTDASVEITLTPTTNGSNVKVQFSGFEAAESAFHQELWTRHLDRIAAVLAGGEPGRAS